jgi:hypothetical protein
MLMIGRRDFDALVEQLTSSLLAVRTLDGLMVGIRAATLRLHGSAIAVLASLTGSHVLVEDEIHLVQPNAIQPYPSPVKDS